MLWLKKLTKKQKLIAAGILLVLIIIGGWLMMVVEENNYSNQLEVRNKLKNDLISKVDSATEAELPVELNANAQPPQDIRKMPKFTLLAANQEWFADQAIQVIGVSLGFNDKASFSRVGTQTIWTQDQRRVTIDTDMGTIEYSNPLSPQNLPKSTPTSAQVSQSLSDFFTKTNLPTTYLDLENLDPVFVNASSSGVIDPTPVETGPLMWAKIPYVVSGVPVYLPFESSVLIDGDGKIHLLNLYLPNLDQDTGMYNIIGFGEAQNLLSDGVTVVIDSVDSELSKLLVDEVFVGYYLNQSSFYEPGTKRLLTPIYVFSGVDGKAAVLAIKQ
jgi:hypothetical protein